MPGNTPLPPVRGQPCSSSNCKHNRLWASMRLGNVPKTRERFLRVCHCARYFHNECLVAEHASELTAAAGSGRAPACRCKQCKQMLSVRTERPELDPGGTFLHISKLLLEFLLWYLLPSFSVGWVMRKLAEPMQLNRLWQIGLTVLAGVCIHALAQVFGLRLPRTGALWVLFLTSYWLVNGVLKRVRAEPVLMQQRFAVCQFVQPIGLELPQRNE